LLLISDIKNQSTGFSQAILHSVKQWNISSEDTKYVPLHNDKVADQGEMQPLHRQIDTAVDSRNTLRLSPILIYFWLLYLYSYIKQSISILFCFVFNEIFNFWATRPVHRKSRRCELPMLFSRMTLSSLVQGITKLHLEA
jgi:hypothetical protein